MDQIKETIKSAFEAYLGDSEKYGEYGWKSIMIDLYDICCEEECPFSADASFGFRYLYETIYFTICKKCGDEKAYIWLKEYASCWLMGLTDFPPFPRECYYGRCT
jgi:hypothetical protein